LCYHGEAGLFLGVAQLVARYLGVVEAAGSSPVTQTIDICAKKSIAIAVDFFAFYYMLDIAGRKTKAQR
jgi:hypothetical protein